MISRLHIYMTWTQTLVPNACTHLHMRGMCVCFGKGHAVPDPFSWDFFIYLSQHVDKKTFWPAALTLQVKHVF